MFLTLLPSRLRSRQQPSSADGGTTIPIDIQLDCPTTPRPRVEISIGPEVFATEKAGSSIIQCSCHRGTQERNRCANSSLKSSMGCNGTSILVTGVDSWERSFLIWLSFLWTANYPVLTLQNAARPRLPQERATKDDVPHFGQWSTSYVE